MFTMSSVQPTPAQLHTLSDGDVLVVRTHSNEFWWRGFEYAKIGPQVHQHYAVGVQGMDKVLFGFTSAKKAEETFSRLNRESHLFKTYGEATLHKVFRGTALQWFWYVRENGIYAGHTTTPREWGDFPERHLKTVFGLS